MGTWKEFIENMKNQWIGRKVFYKGNYHKVVDVDYNGMLLIDLQAQFTETTAIDPAKVDPAGII